MLTPTSSEKYGCNFMHCDKGARNRARKVAGETRKQEWK